MNNLYKWSALCFMGLSLASFATETFDQVWGSGSQWLVGLNGESAPDLVVVNHQEDGALFLCEWTLEGDTLWVTLPDDFFYPAYEVTQDVDGVMVFDPQVAVESAESDVAPVVVAADYSGYDSLNPDFPEGFNFDMTRPVEVALILNGPDGQPLSGVRVDVFSDEPSAGGKLLQSIVTNVSGIFEINLEVPSYLERLWLSYNFIGVSPEPWLILDAVEHQGYQNWQLNAGWNLVPVPTGVSAESFATFIENHLDLTIWAWNGSTYVDPLNVGRNVLLGYWVHSPVEQTVAFNSEMTAFELQSELNPGWNLVGVPNGARVSMVELYPDDLIEGVYFWDNGYQVADKQAVLDSRYAYWVYVGVGPLSAVAASDVTNSSFSYIGTYNSQGVPDYLEPERDVISSEFLQDVNASLPEGYPVPEYNPEYIAEGTTVETILVEEADVWVTFVHEGAGYRNSLGYYTFPRGQRPATVDDITEFKVIFPNVSYRNSGGGLVSGDKVYLGRFPADTVIGYFLCANGWNGSVVTTGNNVFFSDPRFNPETDPQYQAHNTLLWDAQRQIQLLSFEDLFRPYGDNDFNDAVFYLSANPPESILTENIQLVSKSNDTDNDGVTDVEDDYPEDPLRAFDNYSPAENEFATLTFEDLWPTKGDYDFNDLVIDYSFHYVTNSTAQVVDIHATFILRAIGANYHNGFGFALPITADQVASVNGQIFSSDLIELNANGTEAGQTNAVIMVFEDAYDLITRQGNSFVNTQDNVAYQTPHRFDVTISLVDPVHISQVGLPPYNPFIFANGDRSREIHLAGYEPTDLADVSLFGTADDTSDPATGRYYKSADQLPWGLNIPTQFEYPRETKHILNTYLKMEQWGKSNNTEFTDWYLDFSGYRNYQHIYVPQ